MREIGDKRLHPAVNFFINGISASAARAIVNPYSVIKIISEVGAPGAKTGLLGGFYWLVRSQGWISLGKGITPGVVRAFPHVGIQFAVYDSLVSHPKFPNPKRRPPISIYSVAPYIPIYLAGGIAGSVATLVTHPLDVVKVQMIAVPSYRGVPYKGTIDGLTKIMQNEGLNGLYRGIIPSLVGAFAFSGAMFMFWDVGDHLPQRIAPNGQPFVPFEWFLIPCAMVIGASVVTHPFDVIRRKAQNPLLPKHGYVDIRFTNLLDCVIKIHKYTGVPGFFYGVFANAAKVVPQVGVFWLASALMRSQLSSEKNVVH